MLNYCYVLQSSWWLIGLYCLCTNKKHVFLTLVKLGWQLWLSAVVFIHACTIQITPGGHLCMVKPKILHDSKWIIKIGTYKSAVKILFLSFLYRPTSHQWSLSNALRTNNPIITGLVTCQRLRRLCSHSCECYISPWGAFLGSNIDLDSKVD